MTVSVAVNQVMEVFVAAPSSHHQSMKNRGTVGAQSLSVWGWGGDYHANFSIVGRGIHGDLDPNQTGRNALVNSSSSGLGVSLD